MSADYTATLRSRIDARRRRADALEAQLAALQEPAAPASSAPSIQARYKSELAAYTARANQIRGDIEDAENDIESAESQIAAEVTRQRAEKARETNAARSQAGTQGRSDRSAALAAQRETRIADTAAAKEEAAGRTAATQRSRAGQYATGPDGTPYGQYDDDGKLRLLNDKERVAAIRVIQSGRVTQRRQVAGTSAYPGQTPEPTVIDETMEIDPEVAAVYTGSGPGGGGGGSGRTRFPEETRQDELRNRELELDIEKKERDLQGEAAVLLRNHISLIDSVEKMVADGQLKPEQAAEYISTSDKNYRAALRGSTLATEQERMRADRRAKNSLGSDIINQRLSSGANLAAQLSGQAMSSDVMMPAGKSSLGYSPSMLALEMTKELGGGPEVSEFAKRMLLEEDQPWL